MIQLYGSAGSTTGGAGPATLYTIDTNTGIATIIGAVGFNDVIGLALNPVSDTLYGVCCGTTQKLITINRTTGAGTLVTNLSPVSGTLTLVGADCAFNTAGQLFVWNETNLPTDRLSTLSITTGVWINLGASGLSSANDGLKFQQSGTLWLKAGNTFNSVNTTTGAVDVGHPIFCTGPGSMQDTLAFDPSDNGYTIERVSGDSRLISIIPALTTKAIVGLTGVPFMKALEFAPLNIDGQALSGIYSVDSSLVSNKTNDTVYTSISGAVPPVATTEDRAIPEPSVTLYGVGDDQ